MPLPPLLLPENTSIRYDGDNLLVELMRLAQRSSARAGCVTSCLHARFEHKLPLAGSPSVSAGEADPPTTSQYRHFLHSTPSSACDARHSASDRALPGRDRFRPAGGVKLR